MTGNRDYLCAWSCRSVSYERVPENKLIYDGIASIESSFALSQVKYSIALPV
jgi:Lrp/AsnC family leucine-responsive transcriptional regulator